MPSIFDRWRLWWRNDSPNVSFITPKNGDKYQEGDNLKVKVDASDSDGSIRFVNLYINDEFVRTEYNSPYEWGGWDGESRLLENLKSGNYTLRADTYDNRWAKSSSSINIIVEKEIVNKPPVVDFVSPNDGDVFVESQNIYIKIDAHDLDGSIQEVRLYLNEQFLRTEFNEPYEWDLNLSSGNYILKAEAIDNSGSVSVVKRNITVIEDSVPPPPKPTSGFVNLFPTHTWDNNYAYVDSTNYEVPNNAIIVNSGESIRDAINRASNGQTIVIRGGAYRESLGNISNKRLILQPWPNETVWIKGSDVITNWTKDGNYWRTPWNHSFPNNTDPASIGSRTIAASRQMAFFDNVPLEEVGSLSLMGPNKFCVVNQTLWIGNNPSGHTVEACVRNHCLHIGRWGGDASVSGTIVRGLGFAHWPSGYDFRDGSSSIAVLQGVNNITIEKCTFTDFAHQGLSYFGNNGLIKGNTFFRCGEKGIHFWNAHNNLFEHNSFVKCNYERFNAGWTGGGMKGTNSSGNTWRNNLAQDNYSHGFWWDISVKDSTIVSNVARGNTGSGMYYEISFTGNIFSNELVNNQGGGILTRGATGANSGTRIWNNTIVNCGRGIIPEYEDSIVNNLIVDCGQAILARSGSSPYRDTGGLINKIDSNLYSPTSNISLYYNRGQRNWSSVESFKSDTNYESRGKTISNPLFVNKSGGDYSLQNNSPAVNYGESLPLDIANAIGVLPNVPVNVGRLK